MKPKKMPVTFENWLRAVAAEDAYAPGYDAKEARTILAALEYERQQCRAILAEVASHAKDFGGTPRGGRFNALLEAYGCPPAAKSADGEVTEPTAEQRRAFTEAVIPKPRKKLTAP